LPAGRPWTIVFYMTIPRAALFAIPVLGLVAWAEHAHGVASQALAFVHTGWLAAFVDSVTFRLFCL